MAESKRFFFRTSYKKDSALQISFPNSAEKKSMNWIFHEFWLNNYSSSGVVLGKASFELKLGL
jgi:hypothetical protein